MQNKKLIRFVQSMVLLPVMTTVGSPVGVMPNKNVTAIQIPQILLAQKQNIEASALLANNQEASHQAKILEIKANAIDTYFKEHDMPLEGQGINLAREAEKNDLDWRLLAAIAVRESSGGKEACHKATFNSFGWGSCKIGFNSNEEAIEKIAKHLGGNMESTAHHYSGKNTKEILQKYNPPSIVPKYADQVMAIMRDIGPEDVTIINA